MAASEQKSVEKKTSHDFQQTAHTPARCSHISHYSSLITHLPLPIIKLSTKKGKKKKKPFPEPVPEHHARAGARARRRKGASRSGSGAVDIRQRISSAGSASRVRIDRDFIMDPAHDAVQIALLVLRKYPELQATLKAIYKYRFLPRQKIFSALKIKGETYEKRLFRVREILKIST
jgi:hypothetical protein